MRTIIKAIILAGAVLASTPAAAYGLRHYLVAEWYDGGNHFCRYDDGTVLNVSYHICPLSI